MKRGVACICLSAFGFALMGAFVRLADCVGEPLPTIEKAFFRNLVAITVAFSAYVRYRRGGVSTAARSLTKGEWRDLILRSIFGTLGIFANFYAISHIGLGDSMALNKTAPFFTLLVCWAIMGERMSARQLVCVLGAFAGAMLVIKPGFGSGFSSAAPVGLFSGFCAGAAYALLHRLGRSGVNPAFIILFFSAFSCAACVPFLAFGYRPMNGLQFLVLLGAGAAAALGQFGITWAYRFAEPREVAIYDYTGIVFAAIFGFVMFGQIPDILSWLGFGTIMAMAALVRSRVS